MFTVVTSVVILLLASAFSSSAENLSLTCSSPLGLSDGTVKDNHMRASSSFSASTVGALNGRLGTERGGGAWCPAGLVSEETGLDEWLEIDLGREQVVTGVITQGRFAGGQGQEFTEFVRILVWDEEEWREARDKENASGVIRANQDTHSKVVIVLDKSVITRMVRIVPVSKHPRMVCLRVEILGCSSEDHEQQNLVNDEIMVDVTTKKEETEDVYEYKHDDSKDIDSKSGINQIINYNENIIKSDDLKISKIIKSIDLKINNIIKSEDTKIKNIIKSDKDVNDYSSDQRKDITKTEDDKSDDSLNNSKDSLAPVPNYPSLQDPSYLGLAVGVLVTVIIILIVAIIFILYKNYQYDRKWSQKIEEFDLDDESDRYGEVWFDSSRKYLQPSSSECNSGPNVSQSCHSVSQPCHSVSQSCHSVSNTFPSVHLHGQRANLHNENNLESSPWYPAATSSPWYPAAPDRLHTPYQPKPKTPNHPINHYATADLTYFKYKNYPASHHLGS